MYRAKKFIFRLMFDFSDNAFIKRTEKATIHNLIIFKFRYFSWETGAEQTGLVGQVGGSSLRAPSPNQVWSTTAGSSVTADSNSRRRGGTRARL